MLLFKPMLMEQLLDGGQGAGAAGGNPNPGASGTGGEPNPQPGASGTPASAQGGGIDWGKFVEALPEDLRKDSSLQPIKDPVALVKGYISAQKMIGKDKIVIPDAKHATEQDWMQVFRKLGAPEKVEDFKFRLPEGASEEAMDKDLMSGLKAAAVKAGVLPSQFEKIFEAYYGFAKSKAEASEVEYKAQQEADISTLKQEWGQAFESQVKKANVALREFVPNEADRKRLIEDGLGSHPVLLKALANAAKLLKEDQFLGHGDGEGAGLTPEDALKRANKIMGDPNYRNPQHPSYSNMRKEVADLFKVAYPS